MTPEREPGGRSDGHDRAKGPGGARAGAGRAAKPVPVPASAPSSAGPPSPALATSVRAHTRALDRLDASVAASTARLEQAFQGLAMRVEMLESATEDVVRALRDVQATVGGIPAGAGPDPGPLDRWSAEQIDSIGRLEGQLAALATQVESLRRRIPLKGRPDRAGDGGVRLDEASVAAVARSVAALLRSQPD